MFISLLVSSLLAFQKREMKSVMWMEDGWGKFVVANKGQQRRGWLAGRYGSRGSVERDPHDQTCATSTVPSRGKKVESMQHSYGK
jgi:hypothetical protein